MSRFFKTLIQPRNLLVYGHDVVMAYAAFLGAFLLRLGPDFLDERPEVLYVAAVFAGVAAITYLATGLYRHVWEYVSAKDAINILRTATIIVLFFYAGVVFCNSAGGSAAIHTDNQLVGPCDAPCRAAVDRADGA